MGISRAGYRGFYYHFLTANTGRRKDGNVELSLYDTMLLMYGVQSCREYFSTNAQIQTLSRQLFDRVQWDWFVDHSPGVNSNRFHLAWQPGPKPEGTFLKHVDGQTDEAFMVDVLAMGSKAHPTSLDNYNARNRVCGSYPADSESSIMASWKGSLFNYFFASCWLNFQDRGLDLHPNGPRDLWQNDKLAILANRRFCIDHAARRAAARRRAATARMAPRPGGSPRATTWLLPSPDGRANISRSALCPRKRTSASAPKPIRREPSPSMALSVPSTSPPTQPWPRCDIILKYRDCGALCSGSETPSASIRITSARPTTLRATPPFGSRIS
jgi:hypothetical protein